MILWGNHELEYVKGHLEFMYRYIPVNTGTDNRPLEKSADHEVTNGHVYQASLYDADLHDKLWSVPARKQITKWMMTCDPMYFHKPSGTLFVHGGLHPYHIKEYSAPDLGGKQSRLKLTVYVNGEEKNHCIKNKTTTTSCI